MIDAWMEEQLRGLPGWMATLYWPTERHKARAVLVSPDYRTQIGRDGKTVEVALKSAIEAAGTGERQ